MIKDPNQIIKKIEQLQNEIKNCKDDGRAILMQKQLVDILSKTMQDRNFVEALARKKQKR